MEPLLSLRAKLMLSGTILCVAATLGKQLDPASSIFVAGQVVGGLLAVVGLGMHIGMKMTVKKNARN